MIRSARSAGTVRKTGNARKAAKTGKTTARKGPSRIRATAALQDDLAGSTSITPAGGNVFADLGFKADEAENLKVRAQLMMELRRLIAARGLTQAEAGALLGVRQPRVSDLACGKIGLFTIDALVNMLARAGAGVTVSVVSSAA